MTNKKPIIVVLGLILLLALGSIIYIMHSLRTSPPVNLFLPLQLQQNAALYLPSALPVDQALFSSKQQADKTKDFLSRYFSVWSSHGNEYCVNADKQKCLTILSMQQEAIKDIQQILGFNRYYQPYSAKWLKDIVTNMGLEKLEPALAHTPHYGITTANTSLRTLPTSEPNFDDVLIPGEGYPFDRLQESAVWLGTPLRILLKSADKQWLLVLGPGLIGWVPNNTVAYVDRNFMQSYKNHAFATPIARKVDVQLDQQNLQLYLGSLYPLLDTSANQHQIAIPVAGAQQQAELRVVTVPQTLLQAWPLKPSPQQFARLMNQLLGMPYGWGDLDFNSDCSGTLRRLYTAFAIWLPRNAFAQAHFSGKFYSLAHLSAAQRLKVLAQGDNAAIPKPIPYLTLLSFGSKASTADQPGSIGHISMYLGTYGDQDILIMQSAWGLKLYKGSDAIGRAIMGKAVITPLTAGAEVVLPLGLKLQPLLEAPELGITILN